MVGLHGFPAPGAVDLQAHPGTVLSCCADVRSQRDIDETVNPVAQPPCAGWSQDPADHSQPSPRRQVPHCARPGAHRVMRPTGPESRLRLDEPLQAADDLDRRLAPPHLRAANHQTRARAGLSKQRCGFERGLARPYYHHFLTSEAGEASVFGRVRHQSEGASSRAVPEMGQLRRNVRKGDVATGDDRRPSADDIARREPQLEPVVEAGEVLDENGLDVRHPLFLEPAAVRDEPVEWDRLALVGRGEPDGAMKVGEGRPRLGRREARCCRRRLEEHAVGHVLGPPGHGNPDDARLDTQGPKMGSYGQAVGSGADHGDRYTCGRHRHAPPSMAAD